VEVVAQVVALGALVHGHRDAVLARGGTLGEEIEGESLGQREQRIGEGRKRADPHRGEGSGEGHRRAVRRRRAGRVKAVVAPVASSHRRRTGHVCPGFDPKGTTQGLVPGCEVK
jgi:hypothetical protein